ncbi:BglG family transcription antiterminator [Priestia flexa]|uniref:BglG family transcription antiterminator n=1 Tax=Priestia flexa TaxID=86664 RepID=UPI003D2EF316
MHVFITSREKNIIELIIKTSGKHTALSIASFLKVSARTVHRDLKTIESLLKQFNLQLVRTPDEGLIISGKDEQIFKLIQELMKVQPTDQSPKERKLLLVIKLLEEASFKLQTLAKDLGVSITTLTSYLDELADWLEHYSVTLVRRRGVGLEVVSTEINKRKALANYFLVYFGEELIEQLFLLQNNKLKQEKVLYYFNAAYLAEVDRIVNLKINKGQSRLADSDYMGLIIHTCIMLQRSEKGFQLEESVLIKEASNEYQLIESLCKELEEQFSLSINTNDITFLAVVLRASKLQVANAVDYDSIVLGRMIKRVIQDVSIQLHIDLTNDFSLFQGLLAHMEPSIFRIQQQLEAFNPLTEEIKKKYPLLFMAVRNSMEKEFNELSFSDDEIAYVVLHFGSSLVVREENVVIKALVVCPTGIGTSKMLASRIKKEFIEIDSVDVKSIKEIHETNIEKYDLIISTVRLPFLACEYILVNPLLSDEDIHAIRTFLQKNVEELTQKNRYTAKSSITATSSANDRPPFQQVMKEIKEVYTSIDSIFDNLRIYREGSTLDHEQIIARMVAAAGREGLVKNTQSIIQKLKEREEKGGLGIPETSMALFHCRHEGIGQLLFQISHLQNPCQVKGMDGKMMETRNLLLMLAPEKLTIREQEILSLISTSLIEDKEAMMIFSSSNEEMIRKKLEDTFYEYLQNNLIKE